MLIKTKESFFSFNYWISILGIILFNLENKGYETLNGTIRFSKVIDKI